MNREKRKEALRKCQTLLQITQRILSVQNFEMSNSIRSVGINQYLTVLILDL